MAKPVKKRRKILKNIESENLTSRQDVSSEAKEAVIPQVKHKYSVWMLIVGWAAMLVFTFHACTHMVAAGDTWWAMACGRHFVEHGVNTVEPFSAKSHKAGPTEEEIETWPGWAQWITEKVGIETVTKLHPTGWINQNWLTHVIFYKLIPKSSYADGLSFTSNALVYWKFTIYIITVVCVYYTCRLLGVHPALSAVFSCFAMFIGRSFIDIRPAGFSNMLVAVLLLILALVTYRNYLYIWLIVPVAVFWCNVHGGYIYLFIMLVPFIGLHLLICCSKKLTIILYNIAAWPFLLVLLTKAQPSIAVFLFAVMLVILDIVLITGKNNLVTIGFKGLYHSIAAYLTAFAAVIIFNPFHLTNLTHTFVISVSEHAARWREVYEWQPAFNWDNPIGTAIPFLVMFIIAWLMLFIWIAVIYRGLNILKQNRKKRISGFNELNQHKIDLAAMVIAAFTIYMAIRSRRFIPIAGIAGCPVIALLINEIIRWISATLNLQKHRSFRINPLPKTLESYITITGTVLVLFFGTWWGLKFKYIYLDPWPNDSQYNSVFMRMTASDAKPFHAMKFIRDNNVSGNMFNYWTEGGFIAWGQTPDPNTGKTPLQLFMDGRAQAAYDRDTFDQWSVIMSGGLITYQKIQEANARGNELTTEDYREIGQWMGQQMEENNVWVVMMPSSVFDDDEQTGQYNAIRGLENNPDWPLIFFNEEQKIYVNKNTTQGRRLFDGIFDGSTVYPDDYNRYLNLARNWFYYKTEPGDKKTGLDYAIKAFNENPTSAAMLQIIVVAAQFTELHNDIEKFCTEYVQDFIDNKAQWKKLDGYRKKINAARYSSIYLEQLALERNDNDLLSHYSTIKIDCYNELVNMTSGKKW